MRKKKSSKLDRILEIPQEVYSNETRLSCLGFHELLVENYRSILDYQEVYIRIHTHTGILGIGGQKLEMIAMTEDDLKSQEKLKKLNLKNPLRRDNLCKLLPYHIP